jgi:hypothetical protein
MEKRRGGMKEIQSSSPALGPAAPAKRRQAGAGGCYLAPAPLKTVLFEQLDFLIAHAGQDCPPGCATCRRLSRVLTPLLEPFRS